MIRFGAVVVTAALVLGALGCSDTAREPFQVENAPTLQTASGDLRERGLATRTSDGNVLDRMNRELANRQAGFRVTQAEFITLPGEQMEGGNVIFASNRTLKLAAQWAPGDERREADGNNLTYIVTQDWLDLNGGVSAADAEAAIDRSFETWENLSCNPVEYVKRDAGGEDVTVVDSFFGFGGFGNPFAADIVNAGWFPRGFFDQLAEGGGDFIIGVAFGVDFFDEEAGESTDINGDNYGDLLLKEVYYNNEFQWSVDGTGIDVETIALHENGHAVGMGHFGNLSVTLKNGKLHASPRAVMNAVYLGPYRDLAGTDRAAYCGVYGNWPN